MSKPKMLQIGNREDIDEDDKYDFINRISYMPFKNVPSREEITKLVLDSSASDGGGVYAKQLKEKLDNLGDKSIRILFTSSLMNGDIEELDKYGVIEKKSPPFNEKKMKKTYKIIRHSPEDQEKRTIDNLTKSFKDNKKKKDKAQEDLSSIGSEAKQHTPQNISRLAEFDCRELSLSEKKGLRDMVKKGNLKLKDLSKKAQLRLRISRGGK